MSDSQVATEFLRQSADLLDQSMVKIQHCLGQLTVEQVWWRPETSLNSIGNLLLHIRGNLQQWAVTGLTGAADTRDREAEFQAREMLPPAELLALVRKTVDNAQRVFEQLPPEELNKTKRIQEFDVSVLAAISHTTSHFVGHTHQIILMTRLQLGEQYRFQWSPVKERSRLPI